jgi:hypothetical protein
MNLIGRKLTLGNISPLHKAFIVAAAAAATMNFVVQPMATRLQNRKDETLERFNLKAADVAKLAGTDALYVKHPEDFSFLLLAATQPWNVPLSTAWSYNTKGTDREQPLFSYNDKRSVASRGQILDRLTFGLSSAIYPDAIIIPSTSTTGDDILRSFTGRGEKDGYRLPPHLVKELQKIIFLHEVAHSAQGGETNGDELDADSRALAFYMDHDGDADAARVFISLRAMNAVSSAFYGVDAAAGRYASGPLLDHQFFNGPYTDFGQSRRALDRTVQTLKAAMASESFDTTDPFALAAQLTADKSVTLDPGVREVLQLCADGHNFFTRVPAPKPLPTFMPAPRTN